MRYRRIRMSRRGRCGVLAVVMVAVAAGAATRLTDTLQPPPVAAPASGVGADRAADTGTPGPVAIPSLFAADGCLQRPVGDEVSGTGPGGSGSGPDAILAFEHAYYVDRSGRAATAVVAEAATTTGRDGARRPLTGDLIQAGIDRLPTGTRYCVRIRPAVGPGHGPEQRWHVLLTQQQPPLGPHQPAAGTDQENFAQLVTTRRGDDLTLITAITAL
ncbi:hypothetical protein [Nocardia blacklockiae]|uniref:hypothetical protein n=1 Tax=Nocardia blacklockiae TaxID=480036 RepID=UPI001892DDAA|nr:hypothetical protein [Nocardia blacklockiae]MBF6171067.1 hypothetical protein [Nocardia blacklockiae]